MLGPVTLRRAWYHCGECGCGFAPRDSGLGVAGQSMSPGLRKMTDRAAAAVPFAAAAKLIGELAGSTLTGKRAGRRAEADGQAAARVIGAQAAAITARQVIPLPPAGPVPDMLYIAIDGTGVPMIRRNRGQAGESRQWQGPHPRSQTVLLLHPDQHRSAGPPGPRPVVPLVPGHLRSRGRVRDLDGR